MVELSLVQVHEVCGGKMSTETKVVIGVSFMFSPILGAGMLLGYYANVK